MADCDTSECGGTCHPPRVSVPCDPQGRKYRTPISCLPPVLTNQGITVEDSLSATLPTSGTPWVLSQYPEGVDPDQVIVDGSDVTLPTPGDYQFCNGTSCIVVSATTSYEYSVTCSGDAVAATLCGFSEYIASTPPKKYRKRRTTGTFSVCDFPIEDCSLPTCPGSVELSFTGFMPGFGDEIVAHATVTYNGPSGMQSSYTVQCSATYGGVATGARVRTDLSGETIFADGDTKNVAAGIVGAAALDVQIGAFIIQVDSTCMKSGLLGLQVQWDTWNKTEEYSADDCTVETTDTSERVTGGGDECVNPGGVGSTIPCANPAICYSADETIVSATVKKYDGPGCVNNGDGTSTSVGTSLATPLTEELSIEDTEEDALARALANEDPQPPSSAECPLFDPEGCCLAYYSQRTGFQFFYREATINCSAMGLDPDGVYVLRVHYYEGDYGDVSSYAHIGATDYSLTVNPDGTGSTSHVITPSVGKQTAATMMSVVRTA